MAAGSHEASVRARLYHPAFVQHDDLVCILYGREPVGDHYRRSAHRKPVEGFLNELLALVVQR